MSHPARRARLEKAEKGLILATVLFVALVGGVTWWWDDINRDPVLHIPTPIMPSPNAYDDYVKAGDALVWRDNDRLFKARKYGELPSLDPSYTPLKRTTPASAPSPTLQEVEAGVKKNRPALAILRQGFKYEYREPPFRSFDHPFPHFEKYRDLSLALLAEGYVKALDGDWPGATDSYLDAMELGASCGRGGPLLGGLVSITVMTIGRSEMWCPIDHLDAAAARAAAKRLETILAKQPSLPETLEEEKWNGQATLLDIFHMPGGRKAVMETFYNLTVGEFTITPTSLKTMSYNKREVMNHYTAYMDASITEAGKPYALRAPVPMPKDWLNGHLLPSSEYAGIRWAVNDTYNRLLLTMLALRAYRQAQGAYPTTLADLCPKYLTSVPDDPFAKSGALPYQRTGKTYLLYSIGPDGVDNGGTPSADGQRKPGGNPLTTASRGDIVAGVNVK